MGSASSPGLDKDGKTAHGHASADSRLAEIASRARIFTNADGAAIAVREGDMLVTRASAGSNAPDIGTRSPIQGSFTGLCLEKGAALHCEDSDTDARVDAATCRVLSTRSFIVVPVAGLTSFVSVLAVFAQSAHAFTRSDIAVLKSMAEQVGLALGVGALASREDRPVAGHEVVPAETAGSAENSPVEVVEPAVAEIMPEPEPETEPVAEQSAPSPEVPPICSEPLPDFAEPPKTEQPVAEAGTASLHDVQGKTARLLQFPEPSEEVQLVSLAEAIVPAAIAETGIAGDEMEDALPLMFSSGSSEQARGLFQPKWVVMLVLALALAALGFWMMRKSQALKGEATRPADTSTLAPPAVPAGEAAAMAATTAATTNTTPELDATPADTAATSVNPRTNPDPANPRPVRPDPSLADLKLPSAQPQNIAARYTSRETSRPDVPGLEPSKLLRKVVPNFPADAQDARPGERVVLRATVLKDGSVGDVQVLRGPAVFAAPAVAAVKQWLYRPARLNGTPTESSVEVVVKFDRNEMKF